MAELKKALLLGVLIVLVILIVFLWLLDTDLGVSLKNGLVPILDALP